MGIEPYPGWPAWRANGQRTMLRAGDESEHCIQFWLVNLTTLRAGSASYSYISVQLQRQLFERTNPVHRLTPCIRIFSTPFLI